MPVLPTAIPEGPWHSPSSTPRLPHLSPSRPVTTLQAYSATIFERSGINPVAVSIALARFIAEHMVYETARNRNAHVAETF